MQGAMECAGPSTVVFDPTLTDYNFGASHPMSPVRVDLTMQLAHELGVTTGPGTGERSASSRRRSPRSTRSPPCTTPR